MCALIPVAAYFAGIVGSILTAGMDVCLLWVLCVR